MGWKCQPTAVVSFEDCRVPAENLLGKEVGGFVGGGGCLWGWGGLVIQVVVERGPTTNYNNDTSHPCNKRSNHHDRGTASATR